MQYRFLKKPRSRLADVGQNLLGESVFIQTPKKKTSSVLGEEFMAIPNYSAYAGGTGDTLRDFQIELESFKYANRGKKRSHTTNQDTLYSSTPQPRDNRQRSRFTSNYESQRILPAQFDSVSRELLEIKNLVGELSHKQQLADLAIQNKILQIYPKIIQQSTPVAVQPPLYTAPPYPYPYPPPPYPYPPPHGYPSAPDVSPIPSQKPEPPARKKVLTPRQRLLKYLYAVSFPFLLKPYAKKLIRIRKNYFQEHVESKLTTASENIKDWFLEAAKTSLAIILQKKDVELNFLDETDDEVKTQKIKAFVQIVNNFSQGIAANCQNQNLQGFVDYLELTCFNNSFASPKLLTRRQLLTISFSDQFYFQQLQKAQQQSQILIFVFIKMIVYNLCLQPYKFDDRLKPQVTMLNMCIFGNIIYHATSEVIQKKTKDNPAPKYMKPGNNPDELEPEVYKYGDKDEIMDADEYIVNLQDKKRLTAFINFEASKCWNTLKEKIDTACTKIHKLVLSRHKEMNKTYKQMEKSS